MFQSTMYYIGVTTGTNQFKIDGRYTACLCVEVFAGWLLCIAIFVIFFNYQLSLKLLLFSGIGACLWCSLIFSPRRITVTREFVKFSSNNATVPTIIRKTEIAATEVSNSLFNTLIITNIHGDKYKLHPEQPEELKEALQLKR